MFGEEKTYLVTYYIPLELDKAGILTATAIIEADNENEAMYKFQNEYEGQYLTVKRIKEIGL